MTLLFEIPMALTAVALTAISARTYKAIKHLGVGKSFWIPTISSGIFFLAGSLLTILSDLGVSFVPNSVDVVAASRMIGLGALAVGIFMYSRKTTRNLIEKIIVPAEGAKPEPEPVKQQLSSGSILQRALKKTSNKTNTCYYHFGYLRATPKGAPIPEGCLGCNRLIECKHSIVKQTEETEEN